MKHALWILMSGLLIACACVGRKPLAEVQADAKVGLVNTTTDRRSEQSAKSGRDLLQTTNDSDLIRSVVRWDGIVNLAGLIAAVCIIALLIYLFGYRPGNWQRKAAWSHKELPLESNHSDH